MIISNSIVQSNAPFISVFFKDSPWTNAGKGSNLTVEGTVECDASLMDGKSLQYAAVGAVPGKY